MILDDDCFGGLSDVRSSCKTVAFCGVLSCCFSFDFVSFLLGDFSSAAAAAVVGGVSIDGCDVGNLSTFCSLSPYKNKDGMRIITCICQNIIRATSVHLIRLMTQIILVGFEPPS